MFCLQCWIVSISSSMSMPASSSAANNADRMCEFISHQGLLLVAGVMMTAVLLMMMMMTMISLLMTLKMMLLVRMLVALVV